MSIKVTPFIESQIPAIYREDSPLFVAFITEYYKWLERDDNILNVARQIFQYRDIDRTLDDYLVYFKQQYLNNLPQHDADAICLNCVDYNKRFIVKNILDLYRAKGTSQGYKLLFRIVYDADVDIYRPGEDIFKPSDNTWVRDRYIELDNDADFLDQQWIQTGKGTKAFCRAYYTTYFGSTKIRIAILELIEGRIDHGDIVFVQGSPNRYVSIKGSLSYARVTSGGFGYSVGDLVTLTSGSGVGALGRVLTTRRQTGAVEFNIVDGGYGYTVNAIVSVTGGGGTGASFKVGSLSDIQVVDLITDEISPYTSVQLATFSTARPGTVQITSGQTNVNGTSTTFTSNYVINDIIRVGATGEQIRRVVSITNNTVLTVDQAFTTSATAQSHFVDITNYNFPSTAAPNNREFLSTSLLAAFTFETLQIGSIATLANINPGSAYTSNPTVTVQEPDIVRLKIVDGDNFWGNNAIITGTAGNANGIISAIEVVDSGTGYSDLSTLTISNPDNPSTGTAVGYLNGIGQSEGYWKNTKSFADSDKYVQDSYYYQDFSYELRTDIPFQAYEHVVKTNIHQAGTKMFGKTVLTINSNISTNVHSSTISQS